MLNQLKLQSLIAHSKSAFISCISTQYVFQIDIYMYSNNFPMGLESFATVTTCTAFLFIQVIGVVYFNKKSTESLLSFHTLAPLNSCTYVGIDSGATPIQVCVRCPFISSCPSVIAQLLLLTCIWFTDGKWDSSCIVWSVLNSCVSVCHTSSHSVHLFLILSLIFWASFG